MRIYAMTATFGKLVHETLSLQPGLNVIEAPNEWGKSTWCAFLTAMLYGLDTRAKSSRISLADKERFAPWSGSPMSGRIELNWNGRDITIERSTRGRIPMGHFRAYETATGLDVPELTAANCGRQLLGVEKTVFLRSGFLRLKDLPVTEDEALRRRLNALVSTGDENGRGEVLAGELKNLKNRIRYNRSGLLPEAERRRDQIAETLAELSRLRAQKEEAQQYLDQLEDWRRMLENHQATLVYQTACEDAQTVEKSRKDRDAAAEDLAQWETRCASLPPRDTAAAVLEKIARLRQEQNLTERSLLELEEPDIPPQMQEFLHCTGQEAIEQATADRNTHWKNMERKNLLLPLGLLLLAAGVAIACCFGNWGWILGGFGLVMTVGALIWQSKCRMHIRKLEQHYGSADPEHWLRAAESYASQLELYQQNREHYTEAKAKLEEKRELLRVNIQKATEGRGLEVCAREWQDVVNDWDAAEAARKAWQQANQHYEVLNAMAKPAPEPEFPDRMDYSEAQTRDLLAECAAKYRHAENRMGQLRGRMDAIGDPREWERKLAEEERRVETLRKYESALELARETLRAAEAQLQQRFAPRISKRAQDLMGKLTGGRYDRLRLEKDLRLHAGAAGEDTLREILWRSDGTADQLYLALRLVVAEELTPEALLILDDALVRFDDTRLRAALEILKEISETKQILLFTCQSREKRLLQ